MRGIHSVGLCQVAGYGFITVDDGLYVSQNNHVLAGLTAEGIRWAFSATTTGNWRPLTWISLMADSQIYGTGPAGYHVTNLILHVANTLLVFFLFRYLTGAPGRSALVAAFFALHPLHVESVAWISERKDVLSTLFWLLGIWAYLLYVRKPTATRYAATPCAFAMALMAKPMAVSLPVTLLLLDIWPLRRITVANCTSRAFVRLVWEKAPLFVLSSVSCILTFWAQGTANAVTAFDRLPLHIRLANALLAYVTYLEKLLWPAGLALFYPYRVDLEIGRIAACLTVFAGITVLAIRASPSRPFLTFGWLWYVITLLPVVGLVQVGSQALADRYSYVPSLGIFALAVWGTSDVLSHLREAHPAAARRWSWAPPAAACGLMVIPSGTVLRASAVLERRHHSLGTRGCGHFTELFLRIQSGPRLYCAKPQRRGASSQSRIHPPRSNSVRSLQQFSGSPDGSARLRRGGIGIACGPSDRSAIRAGPLQHGACCWASCGVTKKVSVTIGRPCE